MRMAAHSAQPALVAPERRVLVVDTHLVLIHQVAMVHMDSSMYPLAVEKMICSWPDLSYGAAA